MKVPMIISAIICFNVCSLSRLKDQYKVKVLLLSPSNSSSGYNGGLLSREQSVWPGRSQDSF